ncbi:hypothetical protein MLD38_010099 [Melastoma candidum]|uniref:Uncharacterized protein n=1 Tax=Melastoma candidum TaxID=119954 RepID=A0ACB9QYR5_9MYRT|nr:hypothetical protein MLD38_010099 [Melastoma candidum]
MEVQEIVIVGGGICGLAMALGLHRKGVKSLVLERSESLRASGTTIILRANGWRALDYLGVSSGLRNRGLLLSGLREIQVDTNKVSERPLGKGEARCLRRSDLIEALAEELPEGTIRFGSRVLSVTADPTDKSHMLQLSNGKVLKARVLIGCDGVNSVLLNYLCMNPIRVTKTSSIRGLTSYPDGHPFGNHFLMTKRGEITLGTIPVSDNLVYWFLLHNWTSKDDEISKDQELIKIHGLKYIEGFPEKVVEMVKNSDPSTLYNKQFKYRAPWEIFLSSCRKGTATVSGDALHAMTPFNGQGGAASLEDAVVLARALAARIIAGGVGSHISTSKYEEALAAYVKERRMRVLSLCTLSYTLNTLREGPSMAVRLLCTLLMTVFFKDRLAHSSFDCGSL